MNVLYGIALFFGALVTLYLIGALLTLALEWAGW